MFHISDTELVDNPLGILARVQMGEEVVIERDALPIAILRRAVPQERKLSECIALLSDDSTAVIDEDFAKDVEFAIASHPESLEPPDWD